MQAQPARSFKRLRKASAAPQACHLMPGISSIDFTCHHLTLIQTRCVPQVRDKSRCLTPCTGSAARSGAAGDACRAARRHGSASGQNAGCR